MTIPPPKNGTGTAEEEGTSLSLSAAQLSKIKDLFSQFDVDSMGKLPLTNFNSASLKVGPHEAGILQKLKEMDYDSDGFITKDEWEKYFTASATLSEDEFNIIIESMASAAEIATSIIRCTRLAGEDQPVPPADDLEDIPALPEDRVAKVEALFAAWDVNNKGEIDRRKLKNSAGTIGPHKVQVFSQLDKMDTNNDNMVTKDEMLAFFQAAVGLSDEEFNFTVDEMLAVAQDEATIAMLTSLAEEFGGNAPPAEDLEEGTPLTEERLAQLKELWALLSPSEDTPILLDQMKKAEKGSTIGPHSVSVLKEMYAMDTNADGKLQWSELLDYFTKVGPSVSDDEFTEIVGDMTTRIQMQLLAEMVMS